MKIEHSKELGRNIRREDIDTLSDSTWDAVRTAVREGRVEEAIAGIEYGCAEAKMMHDSMCSLADDALTHLAEVAGEEEVFKVLKKRYGPVMDKWLATTHSLKETIERCTEFQRGHFGKTSIREEAERFVVTCDPCGSGGQLRRTKQVGKSKEAHDWTWGKKDVPYYCTHCSVMWEILPLEKQGHPIRINLPPEKDSDPCVHLFYKNPADIPAEYIERISRKSGIPMKFHPPAGGKASKP